MWLPGQIDWFVVLIAVWLLAVGAVIGSFLNVVIYRLPLGLSLVRPASRCPRCLTPIRWYDNLPVIGWLWLGGRCRDCGAPIAARYPWIEALVAWFFVTLAASEFCFGGARDPVSAAASGFHAPWASDLNDVGVWMRYWAQILLGVSLLACGMIERDGAHVPWRLFRMALLTSCLLPMVWREVRPLPFDYGWSHAGFSAAPAWLQPLDGMLGAWMGMAFALLAWPLTRSDARGSRPASVGLLTIGVTLGWQLTAMAGALWLCWLTIRGFRSRAPQAGALSLACVTWGVLLCWRPMLALYASITRDAVGLSP